jgi:hypothetical protein
MRVQGAPLRLLGGAEEETDRAPRLWTRRPIPFLLDAYSAAVVCTIDRYA